MPKGFVTVPQAAEILGLQKRHAREVCRDIPGAEQIDGRGAWLFPVAAVKRLARRRAAQPQGLGRPLKSAT